MCNINSTIYNWAAENQNIMEYIHVNVHIYWPPCSRLKVLKQSNNRRSSSMSIRRRRRLVRCFLLGSRSCHLHCSPSPATLPGSHSAVSSLYPDAEKIIRVSPATRHESPATRHTPPATRHPTPVSSVTGDPFITSPVRKQT